MSCDEGIGSGVWQGGLSWSSRMSRIFRTSAFLMLLLLTGGLRATSYQPKFTNDTPHRYARDARDARDLDTKYLIFPQGSNVQLVYCLTLGTYTRPQGIFTIGVTAGLAWELPHRDTVPYRKPAEVYHRRSRREIYRKIELMLKTQGQDGEACVVKALCKAANRDRALVGKGTFLEEILHSIFTLPDGFYDIDPMTHYEKAYWTNENCEEASVSCPDVF